MITVVGAGMAGLLAGAMLRNECTEIMEAQKELPNNHSALLRFRSPIVGDTLNIPFQRVQVLKAIVGSVNPVADALLYSAKTNGSYRMRSVMSASGQLEDRWIAPPDLIQRMADRLQCPVEFDADFDDTWTEILADPDMTVISTIPMPMLMKTLGWKEVPQFQSVPGFNVNVDIENADAYATLYIPSSKYRFSRVSLTGKRLTVECQMPGADYEDVLNQVKWHSQEQASSIVIPAMEIMGLGSANKIGHPRVAPTRYAKILPTDEAIRKRFILWATEEHRVFSLGRFATWRPGLLLDDLVQDVRVILDIQRNGSYAYRK